MTLKSDVDAISTIQAKFSSGLHEHKKDANLYANGSTQMLIIERQTYINKAMPKIKANNLKSFSSFLNVIAKKENKKHNATIAPS